MVNNEKTYIKKVWFNDERIFIEIDNKQVLSRPLEAFPLLKEASEIEREDFIIGADKLDVRWSKIDEDIHISSFYETNEPEYNNPVAALFKQFPQLNISAFAARMGINKSLMAKYIYGIKKPSEKRKKEIEKELHNIGEKLLSVKL